MVNHGRLVSLCRPDPDCWGEPDGDLAQMPLKLSLKPGEKFVLNGAVVQNGDRRGVLILQNKASVLREKDIMQVEEVTTPAKRIYFPVMMMYLDESQAPKVYDEFVRRLSEFMGAIRNPDVLADCVAASKHVMAREYYKALMAARKLVDYEEQRLGNAAGVQTGGDAD
jgi:flagellar protein FlbT